MFPNKDSYEGYRDYKFKVVVNKQEYLEALEKAGISVTNTFDYKHYLALNGVAKAVPTRVTGDDNELIVNYIVVIRNVYKNQALCEGRKFYKVLENDTWLDPCPFDDYSVLSAKRCFDRAFANLNAGVVKEKIIPFSSIKVNGACYVDNNIYVLTQIIISDEVDYTPTGYTFRSFSSLPKNNPILDDLIKNTLITVKSMK